MIKKYCATSDYNKFTSEILESKIKVKNIVDKSNISNLVKNSGLNAKLATLAPKAELKVEHHKIDLSQLVGKTYLVMMVFRICINQHLIR